MKYVLCTSYDFKMNPVLNPKWCKLVPPLPLFTGLLWPGVVVSVGVTSVGQVDLYEDYYYWVGVLETM